MRRNFFAFCALLALPADQSAIRQLCFDNKRIGLKLVQFPNHAPSIRLGVNGKGCFQTGISVVKRFVYF